MGQRRTHRSAAFEAGRFYASISGQARTRRHWKTAQWRPLKTGLRDKTCLRVETSLRIEARVRIKAWIQGQARRFKARFGIEARRLQAQRAAARRTETRLRSLGSSSFSGFADKREDETVPHI
jgi:hypothetical protein